MSDATSEQVDAAITSRRSVRAFLDTPVPRSTIEDILRVASRAPSGTNMQPWQVQVLTGDALRRFTTHMKAAFADPNTPQESLYKYYPDEFFEPYKSRRKTVGLGLYALLGLGRDDKEGMFRQHQRNYRERKQDFLPERRLVDPVVKTVLTKVTQIIPQGPDR